MDVMTEEMMTDDIRGTDNTGLTVEYAWNIGKAVADWLPTGGSVIVLSVPVGQKTVHAIIEGIRLQGRTVVDGGVGDQDAATAHIKTSGLSGAVVVGVEGSTGVTTIRIYKEDGSLVGAEAGLKEIIELVEAGNFVPAAIKGELTAIA